MTEYAFWMELIKYLGVYGVGATLIFIIWWKTHQAQVNKDNKILELEEKRLKAEEKRLEMEKEKLAFFAKVIDLQQQRESQNFKIWQDLLESDQAKIALLARMEQKIDTNQWCPMVKEEKP